MAWNRSRIALAVVLVLCVLTGLGAALNRTGAARRINVVGYFDNSNGIFTGDQVTVLGVGVGRITKIEPEPTRVKVSFWFDGKYQVPADAKAAILSPALVTSRIIQLTPAYTGGPTMQNNAVIPEKRTVVPMEYDDLRDQLQKLNEMLQPTKSGGISTLGEFVDTAAANLRGQGPAIRDSLIKMSQAFSALGDHSDDIFTSVKNLAALTSALQSSTDVTRQLNRNLAAVTALVANQPNEIATAVRDLNAAVGEVRGFIADNREPLGATVDRLAAVTQALHDSIPDIKQLLHIAPTAFSNFLNIYQPAQGALTGVLALNNFADPINFICGAIQAASRLGAEQAAKLCVQYLAPIVKNRAWNYSPLGENLFIGAMARPNEMTYSEDWMRPDHIPAPGPAPAPQDAARPAAAPGAAPTPTDPAAGLTGMMLPAGAGS